ncbi:MAG: hypothetical protein ACI87E_001951 [Mariniblastus sp.]|jgi:hypothetical protein
MRKTTQLIPQSSWTGICVLTLLTFASLGFAPTTASAQNTIDLKIEFAKGEQTQIKCDVAHNGSVVLLNEENSQILRLPLDVDAKLNFFQLINGSNQAIRYYDSAAATIKIKDGVTQPALGNTNQLIVARLKSDSGELVDLASMTGTLEQPELELLQNQADPLTLANVFSKTNVKEGDKWKPSTKALAKLLRVHEITGSSVELLLKKLDKKSAKVYIMGSVAANVDDVTTKMDISGIALIDLPSNLLSNLKLSIRQQRGPGQVAPGFEGKSKIDIRVTQAKSPKLTQESLAKLTQNRKIRQRVQWVSDANFVVTYEPRWKMIMAESDAALMRYIDKDELLAQCNIVQLPSRPANNPLTLEAYKKEVAKIVAADESASLVSATQVPPTSNGNTAMRVVVAGLEEGLAVNWHYYHIADKDGRQMTFVFTLAESVSNRVGSVAMRLVNEFEFRPAPKVVTPAAAGESAKKMAPTTRKR